MCLFRGSKINQMTEQHLLGLLLYQKVAPAQVFPCELCEIFKSTFYTKHLRENTSTTTATTTETKHSFSCMVRYARSMTVILLLKNMEK